MAQLKAIVLRAEVDGEGNLLQQLRHLVESLSGEKEVRAFESPRTSLDIPHRVTQPRKTETKHAPKLRAPEQRISLEPKWWPEVPTALAKMYELLDSAEAHPGNLSIVSFRDVLHFRGLAQMHKINKQHALITFETLQQADAEKHQGQLKWCKVVKGQWKKLLVFPLNVDLPMWPTEPTVVDASGKSPSDTNSDTYRIIFPKRFLTSSEWEAAKKKPTALMATAFPDGMSFRTYGWHHNVHEKEETVVGFFKIVSTETHRRPIFFWNFFLLRFWIFFGFLVLSCFLIFCFFAFVFFCFFCLFVFFACLFFLFFFAFLFFLFFCFFCFFACLLLCFFVFCVFFIYFLRFCFFVFLRVCFLFFLFFVIFAFFAFCLFAFGFWLAFHGFWWYF